MMGLLAGLFTKLAGPRVLLGVLLAVITAMSVLWWLYSSARSTADQAQHDVATLRQAAQASADETKRLLAERDRLNAQLNAREQRHQRDAAALHKAQSAFIELEKTDEQVRSWTNERVPDAVRGWLQPGAGGADQSGPDKPSASALPELPNAAVQH